MPIDGSNSQTSSDVIISGGDVLTSADYIIISGDPPFEPGVIMSFTPVFNVQLNRFYFFESDIVIQPAFDVSITSTPTLQAVFAFQPEFNNRLDSKSFLKTNIYISPAFMSNLSSDIGLSVAFKIQPNMSGPDLEYREAFASRMSFSPSFVISDKLHNVTFSISSRFNMRDTAFTGLMDWLEFDTEDRIWNRSRWYKLKMLIRSTFSPKMIFNKAIDDWLHWDVDGLRWNFNRWFRINLSYISRKISWFLKTGKLYLEIWLQIKERYKKPNEQPVRWTFQSNLSYEIKKPYYIGFFLKLPTWQHRRPKFLRILRFVIDPLVDVMNVNHMVSTRHYNIDTSPGQELDRLGIWIGENRQIFPPINDAWFTWDDKKHTGWNRAYWRDANNPQSGMFELPDPIFRLLLKAKIIANHWDGSIPQLYDIWFTMFGGTFGLAVVDNLNMTMFAYIAAKENDSVLHAILRDEKLPIHPTGVRTTWQLISQNGPVFAWIHGHGPVISGFWDVARWNDFDYDE